MSEYDTKPTIETVLEAILHLENRMVAGFNEINERLELIEKKMIRQDERIDNFIEDVIEMKRKLRSTV